MTKVHVNNIVLFLELSSEPNVDIIGIIVSMWKRHNFETIFSSNDAINIQDAAGKGFGSQEIGYSMKVNDFFWSYKKKIPHATSNYGSGQ